MATIANWNGHTFEVSPSMIRGFTNMTIQGGCETTTKNSDKQKYEERKYGEGVQFTMTVSLNALTGVTDVFGEAMTFVREATEGACDYFYLGGEKLIPAKLMLTEAHVDEVVMMPKQGRTWISCDVDLTFKQGAKNDGSSGDSSGGSGSAKASVKTTSAKSAVTTAKEKAVAGLQEKIETVKRTVEQAKTSSVSKLNQGGMAVQTGRNKVLANIVTTVKKVAAQANTSVKTNATTGRAKGGTGGKLTTENNRALVVR